MVEIRKPIPVYEAVARVMAYAAAGKKTFVPIEASLGRFLAEDLIADHHVPAFNRTPYDGFALKAVDTAGADERIAVQFEVIGEIGAGQVFEKNVERKQAVRIMTGAQIPEGCDAVVMLEDVEELIIEGKKSIQLKRQLMKMENITPTGEDITKGDVLAEKGTYINPGVMALLATFGYKQIPVSEKPKVGILSTGSELLEIDAPLEPGKIRDSNTSMLIGQIERAGGTPVVLGQFKDDFILCYNQVVRSLEEVDILLTTGGVSVGDYDYIPAILDKLEAEVLFHKISMRPGSVTTVAAVNGKLLFGLSGNPSSCYVGFEIFARPILRAFLGSSQPYLRQEIVELANTFSRSNPFHRFVRGALQYENGNVLAQPVGLDKPNIVTSLAGANCLIMLPGGENIYEKGERVVALFLDDQRGSSTWMTEADKQGEVLQ